MNPASFVDIRKEYHQRLCSNLLGYRGSALTVADGSNRASVRIADEMARAMGFPLAPAPPDKGQTLGTLFTQHTMRFIEEAFTRLNHLRPARWIFSATQGEIGISEFDQYKHLAELKEVIKQYRELRAALEGDYIITPDIIIAREPVNDNEINIASQLINSGDKIGTLTPLREGNYSQPHRILHGSVSCKWTIRSDRSQNTRTEALNLIRNRKGNLPHIMCVTLEPLPSRLASIALGTGDLDCTYHAALYELQTAVESLGNDVAIDLLHTLVEGRRLRDISDLPLDLAI